ncbi:type II toxin-antitoxin system VapC family toxin [Methylocystis sp. Sn-Cys]|uniref:type II toxin-antitoxin system VapC family toxin n=1 Tax=Methylocystis sp. Sn-Cys TaxID=1701263 RepID=UPI001922C494|nr:type II toxin-antitoxin system VapC family toxin [Methylocystis sp. Sn-Cys]MBL1256770.1 type II toxin-antitoxin system VapC family toxin [Methylocystis sp. Sn-Cys]
MRLLLDTHILLAITENRTHNLPGRVRRLVDENSGVISVASLWEIAIKNRLGKLPVSLPLEALPEAISQMELQLLQITAAHVLIQVEPEPPTRDPFDRLLLAQCKVEGLRLVTIDRALVDHPYAMTD